MSENVAVVTGQDKFEMKEEKKAIEAFKALQAEIEGKLAEERAKIAAFANSEAVRIFKLSDADFRSEIQAIRSGREPASVAEAIFVGVAVIILSEALQDFQKAWENVVQEALKEVERQKEIARRVERERAVELGVQVERDRIQKVMNESGNWSNLHPDRQQEILEKMVPLP